MKHYHFILFFFFFILAACSQEPPVASDSQANAATPEVLTVEYLANNMDALKREEERCKNLPEADALQDPVCQNVARVRSNLFDGYTDKGPPPKVLTELPAPH